MSKPYKLRVLAMGEIIEDVYRYGRLLARPSKDPIIAVEFERSESFRGGIAAAAAICENFTDWVLVLSDRTLRKIRYIEAEHARKLFEVYEHQETFDWHTPQREADLCMVIDYGHGMMTKDRIAYARDCAPFLAVNVQTNAGNYGYNLATKYDLVDFLCVDEQEARLATQNRDGDIVDSIADLSMLAPMVVVTRGRHGSVGWSRNDGLKYARARTDRVVDTIGAGDAFFAVASMAAANGAGLSDVMRLGNAAGAAKAQIIGHQRAITPEDLG